MEYEQLEQDYRDDHLAEAMYQREAEWFHYDFDRINFERMLTALPPVGEYREQIEGRLKTTRAQMVAVDLVYAALKSQIIDTARHQAAIARVAGKRLAGK